jgi:carboxylate-amine ligase
MAVRSVGVEEELMLVDPTSGHLATVAGSAVRADRPNGSGEAGGADRPNGSGETGGTDEPEVQPELFRQQLETATEPCRDAEDLLAGIRSGRRAAGELAAESGVRAVAMATPVLPEGEPDFAQVPRYLRIGDDYGELARQALVCATHVHVEVADDDEGVRVIDRIRPWLPLLIAISSNSPYWQGRDTGHASWRSQVWGRWPTAGAAQQFGDVATYRSVASSMIGWGGALDTGMLYFDVRLSERFPTVEVRVADVTTDVEDVALLALLTRALVSTAARDPHPPAWRGDLMRVAGWRAARFGLGHDLVHPTAARLTPVREVVDATVEHARDALRESGDLERVTGSFERLLARGTGATRQRSVFESEGDLAAVVSDLADRTHASWEE